MVVKQKKEVEALGIHVGCVVTYEDEFMILNKRNYVGRALDNRMGGFMIAEVARLIHKNKKKTTFWTVYHQCCTRRDWVERSTDDC